MGRVVANARWSAAVLALIFAVALLIALPAAPASATTLLPMTIEQLTQRAATVVEVKTTSAKPQLARSASAPGIQTAVDLDVTKVLKGNSAAQRTIYVPGGTIGSRTVSVDLMPSFRPGETCILFLDSKGRVIGGEQGKLSVEAGSISGLGQSLAAMESRIASAVSGHPLPSLPSTAPQTVDGVTVTKGSYQGPKVEAAAAQAAQDVIVSESGTVFLSDGFDNSSLSSVWHTNLTAQHWVTSSARKSSGTRSAYCVNNPSSGKYPANSSSAIYAGPYNLSSATTAYADFDLWLATESGFDYAWIMFTADGGNNWTGYRYSGSTGGGWQHQTVDVSELPDILGSSSVHIALLFESDEAGQYEGAYVDQLRFATTVAPPPAGAPVVSSISPTSASAGTHTRVTLNGSHFGATRGSGSVNFFYKSGSSTLPADTIVSWSDTKIVCEVPIGVVDGYSGSAASGPVSVTNNSGLTGAGHSFSVTFGYGQWKWATPTVNYRVNENCTDTTQEKTLINNAAATWSAAAMFDLHNMGACSTADYLDSDGHNDIFWNGTLLPDGVIACAWTDATGGTITEEDICFNNSTTKGFTWGTGSGGTMDIQTIALHELGHWLHLRDLYGSPDSGKVMYGFCSPGLVKRSLTTADRDGIVYIYGTRPVITALSPNHGSATGWTDVTLTGTGFTGVTAVKFGASLATNVNIVSATKITCKVPAGSAGKVEVVAINPAGTSSTSGTGNDYYYANRYQETDGHILWAPGPWTSVSDTGASGSAYCKSSSSSARVAVQFTGTRLYWLAATGPSMGKAKVSVDGGAATIVDLYSATAAYRKTVFETGSLVSGGHMVQITWYQPAGKYVNVDAFDVVGTLASIASTTTYQESAAGLTWAPAWALSNNTSASGGHYNFTNTVGGRVSFSFTGVRFQILGRVGPSYGKLSVSIDGGAATYVDLYASATAFKTVWYSQFLKPGSHTVVIKRAGTHNAASTSNTVNVDAIGIRGTLQ